MNVIITFYLTKKDRVLCSAVCNILFYVGPLAQSGCCVLPTKVPML